MPSIVMTGLHPCADHVSSSRLAAGTCCPAARAKSSRAMRWHREAGWLLVRKVLNMIQNSPGEIGVHRKGRALRVSTKLWPQK
jgi:hypothetical protein